MKKSLTSHWLDTIGQTTRKRVLNKQRTDIFQTKLPLPHACFKNFFQFLNSSFFIDPKGDLITITTVSFVTVFPEKIACWCLLLLRLLVFLIFLLFLFSFLIERKSRRQKECVSIPHITVRKRHQNRWFLDQKNLINLL